MHQLALVQLSPASLTLRRKEPPLAAPPDADLTEEDLHHLVSLMAQAILAVLQSPEAADER